MAFQLRIEDLIEYTDWERGKWREFFQAHGDEVLKIGAGANGDGRFHTVGDLVRHIFSAEARYIDRLLDRELTDPSQVVNDRAEALFEFGARTREQLKELIATFPVERWDETKELQLMNSTVRATPRKLWFMCFSTRSATGPRSRRCCGSTESSRSFGILSSVLFCRERFAGSY